MIIKFLRNMAGNPGYKIGQVAIIEDEEAKRFVSAGYATEMKVEPEKDATEKAPFEKRETATNKNFDNKQKR